MTYQLLRSGVCKKSVMYIHDLGSSFGKKTFGTNPRGDYSAWKGQKVFDKKSVCKLTSNFGSIKYVSEQARSFLLNRLKSLDHEKLMTIFKAGRFDLADPELRKAVRKNNPRIDEQELNTLVIETWVKEFEKRISEINEIKKCQDLTFTAHKNSRKNL